MPTPANELVTREDKGAICRLSLNRPEQGNSLSVSTIDALHKHLIDLRAETGIAVIVLAGVGKKIFLRRPRSEGIPGQRRPGILGLRCVPLLGDDAGLSRPAADHHREGRRRRVGRRVPVRRQRRPCRSGEWGALCDAEFALRAGLVNAVVAPEELDTAVQNLAEEIASKSTIQQEIWPSRYAFILVAERQQSGAPLRIKLRTLASSKAQ